ncbi:MAG: T9SS type A sorting domain-containing protein [Calditrichaeota bacterium]|nr:T9SS type A sorting domain-containing protein [Calditrichota bacterium]
MRAVIPVLCLALLLGNVSLAAVRHVPSVYFTIQEGILASEDGDTVLVAEGEYFENIDFRGHNIVVASQFLLDSDVDHILHTIINGSQPAHEDTGSVVRIINGEDSTTALIGFTVSGGTGTKFRDQNDNLFYVEGGGVIIENSAPLIAFNLITGNEATRIPAGTLSAGGGGIRFGYCAPRIYNNLILHNSGKYGGGVVSFFADGDLRNNVIASNRGGEDYGGGGVWIGGGGHNCQFINNTVVGNFSTLSGGGLRAFSGGVVNGHSNIFWGNRANSGSQQVGGTTAHFDYCCVQGGLAGTENINIYPEFLAHHLFTSPTSPCMDAGNPDSAWNDSDGSRNDIGCYGGPGASSFPDFGEAFAVFQQPYPLLFFDCDTTTRGVLLYNLGTRSLDIDSLTFSSDFPLFEVSYAPAAISPVTADSIVLYAFAAGGCVGGFDTLSIYHSDTAAINPLLVPLYLDPAGAADDHGFAQEFALHSAYPNPFNPSTTLLFTLPSDQFVTLNITDIQGREVARLVESRLIAGQHRVEWNASGLSSGTYFATLRAGKRQELTKLILLK